MLGQFILPRPDGDVRPGATGDTLGLMVTIAGILTRQEISHGVGPETDKWKTAIFQSVVSMNDSTVFMAYSQIILAGFCGMN